MKRSRLTSRNPQALVYALGALALMTGCTQLSSHAGATLPSPQECGLKPGKTTLGEVLEILGPPLEITACGRGVAFLYEHTQITEHQLGLSIQAPVLRYLKFTGANATISRDTLILVFDGQRRLQAAGYEDSTNRLGRGGAVQFVVAVDSLVDSSEFRDSAPVHRWGSSLVRRLPELLNSDQSLEDGRYGFRVEPDFRTVGQRSLEFPVERTPKERKRD